MTNLRFQTVSDVNQFFENWHDLSDSKKLEFFRELRKLGHIAPINVQGAPEASKCPKYNFVLVRPCTLQQCQFYTANASKIRNCIHNSLTQAKKNRLTTGEIAGIIQASQSEVANSLHSATQKIKKSLLHEKIERNRIPQFTYLPGHCVSCEINIQDDLESEVAPDLVIESLKFGWCSYDCRRLKPKWVFLLEQEFHCNYLDIVALGAITALIANRRSITSKEAISDTASMLNVDFSQLSNIWPDVTKRLTKYCA